ncbi:MAG TPA: 30S ribosomal protein S6 [Longilinea sp.]|nr:30S ribosomal protein S6 [Longilinea sp.]
MRTYEVILIVHPDLDEAALTGVVEKTKGWITDAGGTVDKVDMWGKRHLAFAIKKQRDGQYVLIQAQLEPSATAEVDRNLRFLEPVIRFMIATKD